MRFLIVASARTGSSHLVDLLNNQSDILCSGEVFHVRQVHLRWPKTPRTRELQRELQELRSCDPVAFAERIFTTNFDRSHVGFKMFESQNDPMLDRFLDERDILKIVLFRRNVLANYSSKLVASASGEWDLKKGRPRHEHVKPHFDPSRFIKFHNRYVSFYQRVLSRITGSRQPFRFFNYEEINDRHLFTGLVDFIGGDTSKIKFESRHQRQNPSNITSRFSNSADVERFIGERGLNHWAYEGDTSLKLIPADLEPPNSVAAPKEQRSGQNLAT